MTIERTSILGRVTEFADQAHGSQMRKYTNQRYIVHPMEVMHICAEITDALPLLSASLLHDVLEDTEINEREIMTFLQTLMSTSDAQITLDRVIDLTDIYTKVAYPNMNRRSRKEQEHQRLSQVHPDSQTIKYADIISNSIDITANEPEFAIVYLKEMRALLKVMDKGDLFLYNKAVETVNRCLGELIGL